MDFGISLLVFWVLPIVLLLIIGHFTQNQCLREVNRKSTNLIQWLLIPVLGIGFVVGGNISVAVSIFFGISIIIYFVYGFLSCGRFRRNSIKNDISEGDTHSLSELKRKKRQFF